MSLEELKEPQQEATNKFVNQVRTTVDEIAVKNLGVSFIVLAISQQG